MFKSIGALLGFALRRARAQSRGASLSSRKLVYREYLALQLAKTTDASRRSIWLGKEWTEKILIFQETLKWIQDETVPDQKALCVAARTGQEVQALRNLGMDAIGVDLVPEPPLVIEGDMHSLPFPDNSFGFIFSNSIDHSLRPVTFAEEITRVARPGAVLNLHIQLNKTQDEFGVTDIYEPSAVHELFPTWNVLVEGALTPEVLSMNYEFRMRLGEGATQD